MGKGKRSRKRRAEEAAVNARRPPAPEVEWTFTYVCQDCGAVGGQTTGPSGVAIQIPGRCGRCGGHRFGVSPSVEVLNKDDYPNGIDGVHIQLRHDPNAKPAWEMFTQEKIYRVTGERFRYERVFDREHDMYHKRYTNLETGRVEVEASEPLSQHTERGAARKPVQEAGPPAND